MVLLAVPGWKCEVSMTWVARRDARYTLLHFSFAVGDRAGVGPALRTGVTGMTEDRGSGLRSSVRLAPEEGGAMPATSGWCQSWDGESRPFVDVGAGVVADGRRGRKACSEKK